MANPAVINSLKKQKQERDLFLQGQYIIREKSKNPKDYLGNDLIKVITGPRRSGKSTFALLLLKGEGYAYVNLEDNSLMSLIQDNDDELMDSLEEVYGKFTYILVDEIQNLNAWEMFLNKLHRRGYNVFVTGSNGKLLSGELATSLTGRHITIDIFPLSFQEVMNYLYPESRPPDSTISAELRKYLISGGFPEIITKQFDVNNYLGNLINSTIYKDVVTRNRIRMAPKVEKLANYLIANCTREFSYRNIATMLEVKSANTVNKYIEYLEQTFLFFQLNRYSFKFKEQINSNKKIYIVDNGILSSQNLFNSSSEGIYLENMIFAELLRRKYRQNIDLFYYKTRNDKEVDFILKDWQKTKELIQVSYDIHDPKTEKREVSALLEASEELKCDNLVIINWDIEKEEIKDGKTIKYIPAWKWLLSEEKSK